jgi:threonine dehydrogenase-like Zn-dependent dehydrogenase
MSERFIISAPFRGQVESETPPEAAEGEVLCRPLRIGLCGTDRLIYAGEMPAAAFPRIPGHEVVGVILKNNSARELPEGTMVVIDPYKNCGVCHACRNNRPNCCRSNKTLGVQRDGVMRGRFAIEASRVYPLPEDKDVRRYVLAEPLTLALHILQRAGDVKGKWCLVAGVGNVGSLAVRALKEHGAKIIAWSLSDISLETAKRLGADLCVKATDPRAAEQVMEATLGDGPSISIECAGKSAAVEMCIKLTAFAGRVVLVGHSKEVAGIKGSDIVFKELDILGSRNSMGCFEKAIEWLSKDKEKWNAVISHRFKWPDAISAFQLTTGSKNEYSKIVIDFPD